MSAALQSIRNWTPATRLELDILADSMQKCTLQQLGIMYWLAINLMRDHHAVTDSEIPMIYEAIQREIVGTVLGSTVLIPPQHHPLRLRD